MWAVDQNSGPVFAQQVFFLLNHAPQPLYPAASIVLLYMEMEK